MKPGAILLNTARGALVDEEAVADALESGKLAFTAQMLFATEPLPPQKPVAQSAGRGAHPAYRMDHQGSIAAADGWISPPAICAAFWPGKARISSTLDFGRALYYTVP